MARSGGLFKASQPSDDKKADAQLETKDLASHYFSLNFYDELIAFRTALLEYKKEINGGDASKALKAPTPFRATNWLVSWIPYTHANQGCCAEALAEVDRAFRDYDVTQKDKLATNQVPQLLYALLDIYKKLVSTGKISKAIDAFFLKILHVNANSLDLDKLNKLFLKIMPPATSELSKSYHMDRLQDEQTWTEVSHGPGRLLPNLFVHGLRCGR